MTRLTVRILSRYILRQHLAPLGFALGALTALLLLNQVAKQFGSLVGKGLPWGVILEVFLLSVPFIVAMTIPMAVLVAVLHTVSRLASDNEITAMKAGGIGVGRLLAPVLGGAAVLSVLAFAWNDQLLPRSNHHLRTLLVDIQRKKPSFALKEEVINEVVQGQFFLRAARIDPATNRLSDVTIYELGDPERRRIITADSGRMAYTPGGTDLYLTLLDGDIREVKRAEPLQFNRTFFHINQIRVAGVSNSLERSADDDFRGEREMSSCEMAREVALARLDASRAPLEGRAQVLRDLGRLGGVAIPPGMVDSLRADTLPGWYCGMLGRLASVILPREAHAQVPVRPLLPEHRIHGSPPPKARAQTPVVKPPQPVIMQPAVQRRPELGLTPGAGLGGAVRQRGALQRAATYEVEIQKKLAISAACFVFALLGFPLALRFSRGGAGLVIGVSVGVFAVYYIGLIGGEELGDRLIVSPFFAMWTPNVIFTVVGAGLLWLVRHEGGHARGGSWGVARWFAGLRRRRA
ncbi:MAG TPA: LptF/LptG family permease [Gemmatimonadales bacterium]|nr:LptF/LptG family permease [Gemmatimonadales bacterium]